MVLRERRGVKEAFPELALWSAGERLREAKHAGAQAIVSACPGCLDNLSDAARANSDYSIPVYDLCQIVSKALSE
ncbi:MAG: hypothetical protein N3E40_04310 [Dehalococcoidia bacterium]|nr:hypothetical protein [Dehalococcoidia bacterium]